MGNFVKFVNKRGPAKKIFNQKVKRFRIFRVSERCSFIEIIALE